MTNAIRTRKLPSHQKPSHATYRSGAAARMAGIPVSTLRIWEQRYQAVGPTTAVSGHRLYSAADIERIALLRRLTQQGHAISSVAPLSIVQLKDLDEQQGSALWAAQGDGVMRNSVFRIVVVSQAMAQRLRQLAGLDRYARSLQLVEVFDSLEQASQAAAISSESPIDLLLWHAATLPDDVVTKLKAVQDAWGARNVAVTYRFATAAARDALLSAGVSVVREPSDDGALVVWLSSFYASSARACDVQREMTAVGGFERELFDALAVSASPGALPARRFEDAALTEFAGLSSRLACECPGHVAELLMQISSFESYSASCANRHAADAALHGDLQRISGAARMLFELALERVALAEGLALP